MLRRNIEVIFGLAVLVLLLAASSAFTMKPAFVQESQVGSKSSPSHANGNAPWKIYKWGVLSFRYPPGWTVEPQRYRTPPQEVAGEPGDIVGLTISPNGEPHTQSRTISIGGFQAYCAALSSCKCFTIYEPEYTCSPDAETARTFDQLLKTVRYDSPDSAFHIISPAAQQRLQPNAKLTIRWNTKPGLHIRKVTILIRDTASAHRNDDEVVLEVKDTLNAGRFEWRVPDTLDSPGPYIVEIYYVKPMKAVPPALSAARIYEGRSNPFYIY